LTQDDEGCFLRFGTVHHPVPSSPNLGPLTKRPFPFDQDPRQNRDGAAVQAKLDELIRVSAAQNTLIGIEHLKRDFDAATVAAERAIALNPNFADYRVAQVFYSVGRSAKAIEIAKTQMRLDPFHPHFAPLIAGIAYYLLKEYQEAQRWLREATGRAPNHQYGHAFLAAAYAQVGAG
jgi:tetratricopeptide (TPR) repeat protein